MLDKDIFFMMKQYLKENEEENTDEKMYLGASKESHYYVFNDGQILKILDAAGREVANSKEYNIDDIKHPKDFLDQVATKLEIEAFDPPIVQKYMQPKEEEVVETEPTIAEPQPVMPVEPLKTPEEKYKEQATPITKEEGAGSLKLEPRETSSTESAGEVEAIDKDLSAETVPAQEKGEAIPAPEENGTPNVEEPTKEELAEEDLEDDYVDQLKAKYMVGDEVEEEADEYEDGLEESLMKKYIKVNEMSEQEHPIFEFYLSYKTPHGSTKMELFQNRGDALNRVKELNLTEEDIKVYSKNESHMSDLDLKNKEDLEKKEARESKVNESNYDLEVRAKVKNFIQTLFNQYGHDKYTPVDIREIIADVINYCKYYQHSNLEKEFSLSESKVEEHKGTFYRLTYKDKEGKEQAISNLATFVDAVTKRNELKKDGMTDVHLEMTSLGEDR